MSKKGVTQRPSQTALFAALRRTLAHKEFHGQKFGPDYLAEIFLPPQWRFFLKFKKMRINAKNKLDKFLPGMHEYMIARTLYFDDLFIDALNNNIPQIVLLGAGYDTRAYRYENLNSVTKIFELDVPTTQNRKKKCLAKARLDVPENLHLVPINFDRESMADVLERAGYEADQRTLFMWEGVCYYLEPASVDATLEFVSRSSNHESVIAFDYGIPVSEKDVDRYYGLKEFFQTMAKAHSDEKFIFAIDDVESFLANRGLKTIEHLENNEIEERFLTDENGSSIGRITGLFRLVSASPVTP
jgi:methyltransferase (TIGR00027 family)